MVELEHARTLLEQMGLNTAAQLLGPPGVGKTHLAVGLALKALDAGMVVYYTTLSHLIADLKKGSAPGAFGAPVEGLSASGSVGD